MIKLTANLDLPRLAEVMDQLRTLVRPDGAYVWYDPEGKRGWASVQFARKRATALFWDGTSRTYRGREAAWLWTIGSPAELR